ncbi:MAG: glycosyltransferase family 4 protein [Myxococcales bacterium]
MSIDTGETLARSFRPVGRVLMSADSVGPQWNYVLDLSRALANHGVEVVLLSLGKRLTQEQHRAVWAIPSLSVYEEPLRSEWMEDPWHDVERAGEVLLQLEERYRPDVIHLNSAANAVLPFRAPVVVHAHACALAYWRAVYGSRSAAHLEDYRAHVMPGFRRADMVVTSTESSLKQLLADFGPFRDTRVIFPGCDPEAYLPDLKEELVLSAGRLWDPGRNLSALAKASLTLPWPIYVADDQQRPPAAPRAVELLSPGRMHSLGKLSRAELAGWFGRASIYVQPGHYEPSGMAVLEAACSGCALVLADIPSLREVWEDVAVFVAPDDEQQLLAALQVLISERTSRDALAHAARERACGLTLHQSGARHHELYEELAAKFEAQAWARSSRLDGSESALL